MASASIWQPPSLALCTRWTCCPAFSPSSHQDPILSQVKLIAEPWDVGEGGYQVGNFPVRWAEWNGEYRDTMRSFWNYQDGNVGNFAYRLSGSPDLYQRTGRRPNASINFITAHDGFTLRDLVSYNEKHNEANGENNMDGESHNRSYNFGVEGETDDPAIVAARYQQMRNFLATLFFSQGVPMLLGGDEFGRSTAGNNNTYCQDNELSWFNWEFDEQQAALLDFTRRLVRLRQQHPVLHRPKFFQGRLLRGSNIKDVLWLRADGKEMTDAEWLGELLHLGVLLAGEGLDVREATGEPIVDDNLLLLFNGSPDPINFRMPAATSKLSWELVIDTARPEQGGGPHYGRGKKGYPLAPRSVALLCQQREAVRKLRK